MSLAFRFALTRVVRPRLSRSLGIMTLVDTHRENVPTSEPATKMQKVDHNAVLRVKKLSESAILPKRGSAGAAGYDLSR